MNTIETITQMETSLNEGQEQVTKLETALDNLEAFLPNLEALFTYYGSDEWFQHLDLDQAGEIPTDLSRGVLSEDAIYNLILSCRELGERFRQLADQLDQTIDREA